MNNTRNKIFKITLTISLAMFGVATVCLIFLILGFSSKHAAQLGSTAAGIFYYGLLNILLARCYERSFTKLNSAICLCGLVASCVSFVITETCTILFDITIYDNIIGTLVGILSAIIWFSLIYYVHLRTDNTDPSIKITQNSTTVFLAITFILVVTCIIRDVAFYSIIWPSDDDFLLTRLTTVASLISLLGIIATKILNAIFKETRIHHHKNPEPAPAAAAQTSTPQNPVSQKSNPADTAQEIEDLKRQQQQLLEKIDQLQKDNAK